MRLLRFKIAATETTPARDSYLCEIVPLTQELFDKHLKHIVRDPKFHDIEMYRRTAIGPNPEIALLLVPNTNRKHLYEVGNKGFTPSCDGLVYYEELDTTGHDFC